MRSPVQADLDFELARSSWDMRDARLHLRTGAGLDFLEAWMRVAKHVDCNGFPGPVSAADFAAGSAARHSHAIRPR